MGQKGVHIRLLDYVIKQLFDINVKVILPEEEKKE